MIQLIIKLHEPIPGELFGVDLNTETWAISVYAADDADRPELDDKVISLNRAFVEVSDRSRTAHLDQSFPRYAASLRRKYGGYDHLLALYFRLTLPLDRSDDTEATEIKWIRDRLFRERLVKSVEPSAGTQPASISQNYVKSSGDWGVDAEFAWGIEFDGFRGENVQVCLIDDGYQRNHPDLDGNTVDPPEGPLSDPFAFQIDYVPGTGAGATDHGTLCLGILVAKDSSPVTGIAYGLKKCWVSSIEYAEGVQSAVEMARQAEINVLLDATLGAAPQKILEPGDVILIPKETGEGRPVEADGDLRNCLRAAAEEDGLVVVEAAGNKGLNLDLDTDIVTAEDDEGVEVDEDKKHSLAVVVGAGNAPASGLDPLTRKSNSNYGARVDCQGWGNFIATTQETQIGSPHTGEFVGTSGASSIVAGVIAIIQSVRKQVSPSEPFSHSDLRPVLKSLGTWPDIGAGTIGSLPNICELLQHFELLPDTFLRKDIVGPGTQGPGVSSTTFKSPDIIPLKQRPDDPVGYLGGDWDSDDKAETLTRKESGWVFLRLENRGPFPDDATVSLYWTKPGNESSPTDWEKIHEVSVHLDEADSGTARLIEGIYWDQVPNIKNLCLIAVVESKYYKRPGSSGGPLDAADLAFLEAHDKVAFRTVKTKRKLWGCLFFWMEWFQ